MDAVGNVGEFGAAVAYAGEVRHHGEAEVAFQEIADLGSAVAGGAAGAVGDRHEVGVHALQGGGGGAEGLDAGVVLGREKFERAQGPAQSEEFGN